MQKGQSFDCPFPGGELGFTACCGFALHAGWPRLVRSALLAKNSVPHCFFTPKPSRVQIPHKK